MKWKCNKSIYIPEERAGDVLAALPEPRLYATSPCYGGETVEGALERQKGREASSKRRKGKERERKRGGRVGRKEVER